MALTTLLAAAGCGRLGYTPASRRDAASDAGNNVVADASADRREAGPSRPDTGSPPGECASAAQCPTERPICNTGVCVQCTSDLQCSTSDPCTLATCSSTGTCVETNRPEGTSCPAGVCDGAGRCVGCSTNEDCPGDSPYCNVTSATCVECLYTPHCDDANPCTRDKCVDGICTHVISLRPPSSCTLPGGDPGVCNRSGDCVACLDDIHCAAPSPYCDPTTNDCVACLTNDQCTDAAPYCDPTTRTCGACRMDHDCHDTNPCTIDVCLADGTCGHNPIPSGEGSCTVPAGAGPGEPGVCDGAGNCVQCVDNNQCSTPTRICDTAAFRCVQCLSEANCDPGEACIDGTCTGP